MTAEIYDKLDEEVHGKTHGPDHGRSDREVKESDGQEHGVDVQRRHKDVTIDDLEPLPSEQPALVADEDYSVFTVSQKRAIILSGSFIGFLSPMSGGIYYPALNQIADSLNVSSYEINITVTTYLIMQSLAPMMIAGFSEQAGRRPAYFICFTIYIIANLALALENSYVALLILRMLQSAGSSGFIALSQGLVGDCTVSAERGKYVAYASLATLLGPALSPILGGVISQYAGWHWIFWFQLILSVATFIPLVLFLPETCRNIVGNGSVPPPRICTNFSDHIRFQNIVRKGMLIDKEKRTELQQNYRLAIPNPMGTLIVLADFESTLLLIALSLAIACYYAIFTGISKSFYDLYGFTNLQISLIALPVGAGSLISAFTTGKLVDWNYRRHAKRLNFPIQKNRQSDLSNFPIELARMQVGMPTMLLGAVAVVGYGWTVDHRISLAGPVIFLFILGYGLVASSQILDVLMVDIYPGQAADAAAARNICQCLLGAAASAAIEPMSQAMGNGWAYTTLALLFIISTTGLIASMVYGIKWRKVKKEKIEHKKKTKKERTKRSPRCIISPC